MFEAATQFERVGQIAVVRERKLALIAIDDDGLRVRQRGIARGGIARVADGDAAGQVRKNRPE